MKQTLKTTPPGSIAESKPVVTPLKLDSLQPHPLQSQFVDACTPEEDEQLREDLRSGQRAAIEVLPANAEGKYVIVDGHRRVEALREIGATHVNAIIRHDLADAGEAAIEMAFLGANLHRRHLSPMQKMRVTRRMVKIELSRGRASGASRTKVKSGLAKVMGISPRMLNRYLLATDAPVEVQRAVDAGLLTLVEAGKIALLPAASQADLAERMRSPISRTEVKKHLKRLGASSRSAARHVRINDALASFV